MKKIDMLITSSSRPQLFPYCWESFKKYVVFSGQIRVFVHEDFVFPDKSKRVINYLEKLKKRGEIHEYCVHSPAVGLGRAMDFMLRSKITANYMIYLQEDWEFERPVDLDRIIWTMENHHEINLLLFNKFRNMASVTRVKQPQFTYKGLDMCLSASWAFLPGIWRMSHAMKYWRMREHHPEGYMTNSFGTHQQRANNDYSKKIMGAYWLGKIGEPRYVRHIGNNWRMASWRLEKGRPGGRHDAKTMDFPHRANWLPIQEDRPVQGQSWDERKTQRMLGEI